jgi:hypothetical protein
MLVLYRVVVVVVDGFDGFDVVVDVVGVDVDDDFDTDVEVLNRC